MSSLGRKLLMSLSGMGLCLFLLLHMAGNLIILKDPDKYNDYSHMLVTNPLLLPAELGLLALIGLHIYVAIRLTMQNRAARPVAYAVTANTGRSRRTWYSSYMAVTGTAILAFIVYHLLHFKWGEKIWIEQGGEKVRDLAALVNHEFHETDEVAIYVVAMLVIMVHLLHGVRSLWDTLGVATSFWDKTFMWLSRIFVIGVMGGFIIIPLIIYFRG